MVRISKVQLSDGIFLLRFASQYQLAATFLRFQEHFESSRFNGRTFTLEEYMDWYAGRFGNFTYFQDWTGFNIPSTALAPFYAGRFDPLMAKERRLLALLRGVRRPFYVIGVVRGHSRAELVHEVAHALFFTSPEYRREVMAAMRGHETAAVRRALSALGYARHVLRDEIHAYLVAGDGTLPGLPARKLRPLSRTLKRIFAAHSRGLLAKASGARRAPAR